MLAADRASAALGIDVVEHGPGWARARMTVRPDMVNGHDLAHGGLVFALADTAFACACNSWGPATVAAGADPFAAANVIANALVGAGVDPARVDAGELARHVTVRRGDEEVARLRGRSRVLTPGQPA